MKRVTYTTGPESLFLSATWVPPGLQAVQGFSGVLGSKKTDVYYFISDNGYGNKANSASVISRLYKVKIKFNDVVSQSNSVDVSEYLNFNDSDSKLGFKIQADNLNYYNDNANNQVDSSIREKRLLTGSDIDPESIRIDKYGHLWIGEEFGPFIIKTDQNGKVLRREIAMPGIISPDSPYLKNAKPTIASSSGFEGMAINPSGDKLFPMLEKPVIGDPKGIIRLFQFDIETEQFDNISYRYQLDKSATEIRDLTAINDNEFVVIEQNTASDKHAYKKVYQFSIDGISDQGLVTKTELVDLMNIHDPNDLNHDGDSNFSFALDTIEDILILDDQTLLIANDNNFQTRTFFIKIHLDKPLKLASVLQPDINTKEWTGNFLGLNWKGYHSLFGWITVFAYLVVSAKCFINFNYARKIKSSGKYFWLSLLIILVIMTIYRQYNLQVYLIQYIRDLFHDYGWYENRKVIQKMILEGLSFLVAFTLVTLLVLRHRFIWRYKITISSFLFLFAYKFTEAISYHPVDQFLMAQFAILRAYHLVELGILTVILLGVFVESHSKRDNYKSI